VRQQRRLALEQEVAELKQQLSNEETVHHILERALQPSSAGGRSVNIPAFIPGKVKELLAELVLVEEEIARLENQIKQMKQGAATVTTSNGNTAVTSSGVPMQQQQQPTSNGGMETKSMFFITQAMGGEYLKRHLADDNRSPKSSVTSLGLPPRHSHLNSSSSNKNSKASSRHELPITTEISCSPSPTTSNKPNKLSERILKCLVCIFIRLLRSSRVAESAGSSATGSFRMDSALNVATGGSVVASSKERDTNRGQQDHYGIFGIPDAIVRDVGPYKNLVRFTSSSFDLRGFSSSPLLTKLRGMLEALQRVDLRSLNRQQKLAFWLNVYNTCIMHGILQHGLPSSSEKLLALKNKATINVSGQMFNALVIENFILRQPSSVKEGFWKCDVDVEEQEVRGLYGLTSSEPNILFALCCGIRSSPAVISSIYLFTTYHYCIFLET
jgi:hypothetical protein